MQLIWHIFTKDARRLWWEIAVAIGLLIGLARMDAWRADYLPDPIEGWLNLLLPFTWSYLIALVVLEDRLVGDRQFWVSMPCRWPVLLTSKLLFTITFIHLPYLMACAVILSARDFGPWSYVPQLLWKQLSLLVVLTLPSLALAAVTRNIAQFMLAAVVLVAAVVFVDSPERWMQTDYWRNGFSLAALTVGAVAVSVLQYARRYTTRSRVTGMIAVLAAVSIYMWLPREASAKLRCVLSPAPAGSTPSSLRIVERLEALQDSYRRMYSRIGRMVAIPVEISGAPGTPLVTRFSHLSLQIEAPSGEVIHSVLLGPSDRFEKIPLHASLLVPEEAAPWLMLTMSGDVYERLKASPVTVRGQAVAALSRNGAESSIPINGGAVVQGGGHCSSSFVEGRMWDEMLKVHCEDPTPLPLFTRVRLNDAKGTMWNSRLGSASSVVAYPRNTWLSPLYRRDTFFNLVSDKQAAQEGNRWLVPRSAMPSGKISVIPESNEGCTVFDYELRNVDLSRYTVQPQRQ